jgi:hypothetical protein
MRVMMNINEGDIEFSDTLDIDGDMELTINIGDGYMYTWINKEKAEEIIKYLQDKFNL